MSDIMRTKSAATGQSYSAKDDIRKTVSASSLDVRAVEKHRLRLELQHRRKLQQLQKRLENRRAKKTNKTETARHNFQKQRRMSGLSQLVAAADKAKETLQTTSTEIHGVKVSISPGIQQHESHDAIIDEKEDAQWKLQERLRDRRIELLKQRQKIRKKRKETVAIANSSISSSDSSPIGRRATRFGAVAAREMNAGSYSSNSIPSASSSSKTPTLPYLKSSSSESKSSNPFTLDDFDNLEDEDFDLFLEVAQADKDLKQFDNKYGHKLVPPSGSLSSTVGSQTKPSMLRRQNSFSDELEDLINDIM